MIILKANKELQMVFQKVIHTLGKRTDWQNIFLVLDNSLVLYGKNRCLFFSFDKKRVFESVLEVPVNEERAIQIETNPLLTNTLNMTLYVFGKWGILGSLVVEHDYNKLNRMFTNTWSDIKVEPAFTDMNFRFYFEGMQITYEEVVQKILDKAEDEAEEEGEDIGLWHQMRWKSLRVPFSKNPKINKDKAERLGNNFYPVGYMCPKCHQCLHMVVYPEKKEVPIDTDEGKVYLARMYTCNVCNRFYTPKPQMLINEGHVYILDLEEDKQAYEDYLEIAGKKGERTTNPNFNEYERDYGKNRQNEKADEKSKEMTEDEAESMADDGGNMEKVEFHEEIKSKASQEVNQGTNMNDKSREKRFGRLAQGREKNTTSASILSQKVAAKEKNIGENKHTAESLSTETKQVKDHQQNKITNTVDRQATEQGEDVSDVKSMTLSELREMKRAARSKPENTKERDAYLREVEQELEARIGAELHKKAAACSGKKCKDIAKVIRDIENEDYPQEKKQMILDNLRIQQEAAGKKEIEQILASCPSDLSQKQYETYRQRLKEYKDMGIDIRTYETWLEDKRDSVEKQEIQRFIRRYNPKSRDALQEAYQTLPDMHYSEKNVKPVLQKIYDKIAQIDEAAIAAICPEPADVTFDEGVEAYEQIEAGVFLPELKTNALEKLDKRLQKLKADEAEKLIRKLAKELDHYVHGNERIHFCDIRKLLRQEDEIEGAVSIALKSYAMNRLKYEYPLLVCDASKHKSGTEGFVLTPDHVYYKTAFSADVLEVRSIEKFEAKKGLFKKCICAVTQNQTDVKISNLLEVNDIEGFQNTLNRFLEYLKEKPQSRKISYLAKETHKVKCCYRCGYVYKDEIACPKCGSRQNS